MNAYTLALACGLTGLIAQAYAAGLATELCLRRESSRETRLLWISLAIGALLLALQHGYALELALRTGLYDLRQSMLGALAALLFALAVFLLRRRA